MADGKITIKVTVDGKDIDIAAVSLDDMGKAAKDAGRETGKAGKDVQDLDKKARKLDGGLGKVVIGLGLVAIGAKAFKILSDHMKSAIDRFDKLNNMPRVLEQLGAHSDDARMSVKRLADGIEGLPTTLDEIAQTMQQMFLVFRDADKATDSALALNNALLASGTAGGELQTGIDMYMKALQKGKPSMMEWQSMLTRMSVGVDEVAQSYGMAVGEFGEALRTGEISMAEFNDRLIEFGTGTGKLAEIASTMTGGIGTSFKNLGTAVTKGLANLLTTVDDFLRSVTGKGIAELLDGLKRVVNAVFDGIRKAIEFTIPFFKFIIDAIKLFIGVLKQVEPLMWGLVAAFIAYKVVTTYGIEIQKLAYKIFDLVTELSAATVGTNLLSAAQAAWKTVLNALKGPVGWVTLAIGALVAVVMSLDKWANDGGKRIKELKEEISAMSGEVTQLTEDIGRQTRKYDDIGETYKKSTAAIQDNVSNLLEMMDAGDRTAGAMKVMDGIIEDLNGSVDGLNVAYDEQRDSLNMNEEVLRKYIETAQKEKELAEMRQGALEIEEKRVELKSKYEELTVAMQELNTVDGTFTWNQRDKKKAMDEGLASMQEIEDALHDLAIAEMRLLEETSMTEAELIQAANDLEDAKVEAMKNIGFSYETLSDDMRKHIDDMIGILDKYRNEATNILSQINDETEITFDEIMGNLQHNAMAMGEFMNNISELVALGLDERMIDEFIQAGPGRMANAVQAIVDEAHIDEASIAALNANYRKAADVPTQGMIEVYQGMVGPMSDEAKAFIMAQRDTMWTEIRNTRWQDMGEYEIDQLGTGFINKGPEFERKTVEVVTTTADKIRAALEDPRMPESARKAMKMITGSILDEKPTAEKASKGLGNSIIGALKGLLTKGEFSPMGENITGGIDAGIQRKRSSLLTTASNLANAVKSTISRALDIKSPSRVMEKEIGRFIPEGIGVGIRKYGKTLFDEVEAIIEQLERMFGRIDLPMPGLPSMPPIQLATAEVAAGGSALRIAGRDTPRTTEAVKSHSGASGGMAATTITGNQFVVREEADIYRIARELDNLRSRKER